MEKAKYKPNSVLTATNGIDDTSSPIDPTAQRVAIVMATYDGSRFVEEQIRSIQSQSFSEWLLYVRDDGSRDDTVQKVFQIEREDNRVKLIRDDLGNQGAIGNFSTLMKVALEEGADYLFFADQDDVWHQDKLAIMLGAMHKLELANGKPTPLLVHCDLAVVDEELHPIADSFVRYSRLSPTTLELGVLLCENQVTGCACAINRSLLELASPIPRDVLMHDWWLALLASSIGKIGFISKPLVMYRQHFSNVLGAMSFGQRIKKFLFSLQQWELQMRIIRLSFIQAALLEERIKERGVGLSPIILRQINVYSQILNFASIKRVSILRAHKIGRSVSITSLVFNLLIMIMAKKKEAK